MGDLTKEILDQLKAPFPTKAVKWKPQGIEGGSARALAYVNVRTVMDRLDETVGGAWEFHWAPDGKDVIGVLTVCGVTREDAGLPGQGEAGDTRKAAVSDALKRAAVMFGIGRYLYRIESRRWPGEMQGKRFVFTPDPQVPAWATPEGYAAAMAKREQVATDPAAAPRWQDQREDVRTWAAKLIDELGMGKGGVNRLFKENGLTLGSFTSQADAEVWMRNAWPRTEGER